MGLDLCVEQTCVFCRQGFGSLTFDLMMAPAVLVGALTGKWVLQHIEPKVFEILVIVLTAISTLLLLR